jgi:hypothetical protein
MTTARGGAQWQKDCQPERNTKRVGSQLGGVQMSSEQFFTTFRISGVKVKARYIGHQMYTRLHNPNEWTRNQNGKLQNTKRDYLIPVEASGENKFEDPEDTVGNCNRSYA